MIVTPDFLDHWKTKMLIDILEDEKAPLYLIRLWSHCQMRKRFEFDDLTPDAVKAICRFKGNPSDLENALILSGYCNREESKFIVLNWDEYNEYLVSAWRNGKKGGRPSIKNRNRTETDRFEVGNRLETDRKPTANRPLTDPKPIREDKIREDKIRYGDIPEDSLSLIQNDIPEQIKKASVKPKPSKRQRIFDEAIATSKIPLPDELNSIPEIREVWSDWGQVKIRQAEENGIPWSPIAQKSAVNQLKDAVRCVDTKSIVEDVRRAIASNWRAFHLKTTTSISQNAKNGGTNQGVEVKRVKSNDDFDF